MSPTHFIERALTLLPGATVVVCALFAAQIANDFLEARYIGEAVASVRPSRDQTVPVAAAKPRSKAGAAIGDRNMFCSDCETSSLEPRAAVAAGGDGVPDTQLAIQLISTNVSTDPASSFASLANATSGHKGAYWIGHSIPGAGPIQVITGRYVDFHNQLNNRLERVRLDRQVSASPGPRVAASPARTRPTSKTSSINQQIEDKVKQINATTWEVDRSVLQLLMSNPRALRGARVAPAVKDGKIAGFRISRLSSRSPVAKIGVKRGDVIRAANGVELNSPDVVLGFVTQVQTLDQVKVTVDRGGKPIELTYQLR